MAKKKEEEWSIIQSLEALEEEKGISKDAIFDAMEDAFKAAARGHFGKFSNARDAVRKETDNKEAEIDVNVEMNRETGAYKLFQLFTVVRDEEYTYPNKEITKSMLKERFGVSLNLGEVYAKEFESAEFSRVAVQTAKNTIIQKIREEERKSIYEYFKEREHTIVTGEVRRVNSKSITINLGRADAILLENDQVKTENYKAGNRIRVYISEVIGEEENKDAEKKDRRDNKRKRGLTIKASRSSAELVRKLFESEVAEIKSGVVEIVSIAREAGSRTKMAVWSNDENVDPIGACVGLNGTRVNAIVDELDGEKIDIVQYDDRPAFLIENAISPARITLVLADEEEKSAIVIVPDDQLSLAIGKAGQNVRLVAKLTGFKVDIKSNTQAREEGLFEEIGYVEDYEESDEEEYEEEYEEYEEAEEEYEEAEEVEETEEAEDNEESEEE